MSNLPYQLLYIPLVQAAQMAKILGLALLIHASLLAALHFHLLSVQLITVEDVMPGSSF